MNFLKEFKVQEISAELSFNSFVAKLKNNLMVRNINY